MMIITPVLKKEKWPRISTDARTKTIFKKLGARGPGQKVPRTLRVGVARNYLKNYLTWPVETELMASKINTDARGNQPNLDTLVTAEIVPGEKIVIEERSEETIIIINVGEYLNPASVKEDMEIINMEFSGTLCINISDPLMMSKFVQDPTSDPAYDSKHGRS